MPSGTPSLLVYPFGDPDHASDPIGCVITTDDGRDLVPAGRPQSVTMTFWAPEAEALVAEGLPFALWYARFVGAGVVTGSIKSSAPETA